MFTPSTFPKSPTLPSDSFKAPLWALVSRILGAVHPKSRPRAMWAWHSLVEKNTYLMRCDLNLCRRCKSKALENLLVEQDISRILFYVRSVTRNSKTNNKPMNRSKSILKPQCLVPRHHLAGPSPPQHWGCLWKTMVDPLGSFRKVQVLSWNVFDSFDVCISSACLYIWYVYIYIYLSCQDLLSGFYPA